MCCRTSRSRNQLHSPCRYRVGTLSCQQFHQLHAPRQPVSNHSLLRHMSRSHMNRLPRCSRRRSYTLQHLYILTLRIRHMFHRRPHRSSKRHHNRSQRLHRHNPLRPWYSCRSCKPAHQGNPRFQTRHKLRRHLYPPSSCLRNHSLIQQTHTLLSQ